MARLIRLLAGLAAGVVIVLSTLFCVLLFGIRTQSPVVLDRVRRLNRGFSNPRALRTAGQPDATYSIVEHVGRRSGSTYSTPIGAVATGDGFVIGLPYGAGADWVRNVLVAQTATLVHDGERIAVDQPELIAARDAERWLPTTDRYVNRLFGIERCLLVHRADVIAGSSGGAAR